LFIGHYHAFISGTSPYNTERQTERQAELDKNIVYRNTTNYTNRRHVRGDKE